MIGRKKSFNILNQALKRFPKRWYWGICLDDGSDYYHFLWVVNLTEFGKLIGSLTFYPNEEDTPPSREDYGFLMKIKNEIFEGESSFEDARIKFNDFYNNDPTVIWWGQVNELFTSPSPDVCFVRNLFWSSQDEWKEEDIGPIPYDQEDFFLDWLKGLAMDERLNELLGEDYYHDA